MISARELRDIIISVIIVAIVFGFNDKQAVLNADFWTANFIKVMLGAAITILLHTFAHKIAVSYYGGDGEYRLWTVSQFGFKTRSHFEQRFRGMKMRSFPIGPLLSLLTTLASNGRYYLAMVESFVVKEHEHKKLGKDFPHITEFEKVKVLFAGPLSNVLLAYLLFYINSNGIFDQLIIMNILFALYHMIPVSSLDGAKIFFGSRSFYMFAVIFLGLSSLLLFFINLIAALMVSLVAGGIAALLFYYFVIYK